MKEKHIENLSKGKKSGAKIGSRAQPHRLRRYEQEQFSRAIKLKFLRVSFDSRENVINIWRKYCQSREWQCVIIYQKQDGKCELEVDNETIEFSTLSEAKAAAILAVQ